MTSSLTSKSCQDSVIVGMLVKPAWVRINPEDCRAGTHYLLIILSVLCAMDPQHPKQYLVLGMCSNTAN